MILPAGTDDFANSGAACGQLRAQNGPVTETVVWGTARAKAVLATTILGSGMAMLDSTIVNIALPSIGAELEASVAGLQWILDGYLLALASLILIAGSLGDRYGRRRVFTFGVL